MQKKIKINFEEKIELSPFEKYLKYDRFPYKFVIHVFLVFATTYLVYSISTKQNIQRVFHQVFKKVLLDSTDEVNTKQFLNIEDFKGHLKQVCDNLINLNNIIFQDVDVSKAEYQLESYFQSFNLTNTRQTLIKLDITQNQCIKSPFNVDKNAEIKAYINQVAKMNLIVKNINSFDPCLIWDIRFEYNFDSYADIRAEIFSNSRLCENQKQIGITFIHFIIIILAFISLFLCIKNMYDIGKKYIKCKIILETAPKDFFIQQQQEDEISNKLWDEMGIFEKLKFYNIWYLIAILGNFIQIIGSFISLLKILTMDLQVFDYNEIIIGFGCAFAWLLMLNYIQYNDRLNLISNVIINSFWNMLWFLIGVIPLYMGFVFLFQAIFWKYTKFEYTSYTVVSLFALFNGDINKETLFETYEEGIFAQIVIFIFLLLFLLAVYNILIIIIMEGYYEHKRIQKEEELKNENLQIENKDDQSNQQQKASFDITQDQQSSYYVQVLNKLKANNKRIIKLFDKIDQINEKIRNSDMLIKDKDYLIKIFNENLDNIDRGIKFQLASIRK